jgi:hypothetical protein
MVPLLTDRAAKHGNRERQLVACRESGFGHFWPPLNVAIVIESMNRLVQTQTRLRNQLHAVALNVSSAALLRGTEGW